MPDDQPNNGPWLTHTIQRIEKKLDTVDTKVDKCSEEVASLKVKASIWGGIAGVVGGAVGGLVALLKSL